MELSKPALPLASVLASISIGALDGLFPLTLPVASLGGVPAGLLASRRHSPSTLAFNSYAGLWSDAVMSTLQNSVLEVIRYRCEAAS